MEGKHTFGFVGAGLAVAGVGVLGGCTTQPAPTTPTTIPSPPLGCYTAAGNNDLKVVGPQGTLNALEVYSEGSGCTGTMDLAIPYVYEATTAAALTKCQAVDAATVNALDLSAWTTPSPGLSTYFACSPK